MPRIIQRNETSETLRRFVKQQLALLDDEFRGIAFLESRCFHMTFLLDKPDSNTYYHLLRIISKGIHGKANETISDSPIDGIFFEPWER